MQERIKIHLLFHFVTSLEFHIFHSHYIYLFCNYYFILNIVIMIHYLSPHSSLLFLRILSFCGHHEMNEGQSSSITIPLTPVNYFEYFKFVHLRTIPI